MIREVIIRKIVERDVANRSLLEQEVQCDDELLYAAATEEFGSWDTALEYGGVNVRHVGPRCDLSANQVKRQLRRLCTTGYDLGATVNRSRDRGLCDAAIRHFGSWREALKAAGVNLANVTRHRPKNLERDAMLLWIRNRKESGQTIVYTEVCLENRDYALAIKREFRSWARAVREAFREGVEEPASELYSEETESHRDVD